MIAQTQCSQAYQKLIEKFWLSKNSNKSCQVWTMVNYRLELQTLARNCVLGQSSYVYISFSWLFVVPSPKKGKKYTHYNLVAMNKIWINPRLYSVNSKIL